MSPRSDDAQPRAGTLRGSAQRLIARPASNADASLVNGLMRGVTVFRFIALFWAMAATTSSVDHLAHPVIAACLLGVMAVWSGLVALWPRWGPVLSPTSFGVIVAELAIGAGMLVADGLVYESLARPVSLPWSWPAAGVMAAGIMYGIRAGLASALLMVAANLSSDILLSGAINEPLRAFSRLGLWSVSGALAGYVASRLRQAAVEVSVARAREELSRQLHDGVLQTLAVIQRRSEDRELATLARDQELELRSFLSLSRIGTGRPVELEPELRRLAKLHESRFGGRVDVVVASDTPDLAPDEVGALAGAVGEALTNAGKHAGAAKVTVYAEPADEWNTPPDGPVAGDGGNPLPDGGGAGQPERPRVVVSVKDDGHGFDPATVTPGIGLARSIRGRMEDAGGRVELTSRPGRGTEVRLWL